MWALEANLGPSRFQDFVPRPQRSALWLWELLLLARRSAVRALA